MIKKKNPKDLSTKGHGGAMDFRFFDKLRTGFTGMTERNRMKCE